MAGIITGGTFTGSAATNTLTTSTAHGLFVGDRVQLTAGTGALPTGLSAATDYYVLTAPTTTTLTLSATRGGSVIDITANGGTAHIMRSMAYYTLSRKTEKAFKGWIQTTLDITGMNYYEGHEKADTTAFPALVVYAESSSPHPEFPTECGVRIVKLRCKFMTDSTVQNSAQIDTWKEALQELMTDDIDAMKTALNKPSGTDSREIKKVHFHYIEQAEDASDTQETDWIDDAVYNITCELLDE